MTKLLNTLLFIVLLTNIIDIASSASLTGYEDKKISEFELHRKRYERHATKFKNQYNYYMALYRKWLSIARRSRGYYSRLRNYRKANGYHKSARNANYQYKRFAGYAASYEKKKLPYLAAKRLLLSTHPRQQLARFRLIKKKMDEALNKMKKYKRLMGRYHYRHRYHLYYKRLYRLANADYLLFRTWVQKLARPTVTIKTGRNGKKTAVVHKPKVHAFVHIPPARPQLNKYAKLNYERLLKIRILRRERCGKMQYQFKYWTRRGNRHYIRIYRKKKAEACNEYNEIKREAAKRARQERRKNLSDSEGKSYFQNKKDLALSKTKIKFFQSRLRNARNNYDRRRYQREVNNWLKKIYRHEIVIWTILGKRGRKPRAPVLKTAKQAVASGRSAEIAKYRKKYKDALYHYNFYKKKKYPWRAINGAKREMDQAKRKLASLGVRV